MPRITNIHVNQKTNLGNYESFEFSADAVIADDEDLEAATASVVNYVDWHAKKTLRDGKRRQYIQVLADENSTDVRKTEAESWLRRYDARKAEVEAM